MKKIISIVLCIAMIFALAAVSFGATALGTFSVNKTDAEGNPLAGAEFVLIGDAGEAAYSAVSDENGIAVFDGVADGTYILKENTAPEGYIKSEEEYTIYVVNGNVISGYAPDNSGNVVPVPYSPVTFVNEEEEIDPITIFIPITKIVEKTGALSPNAETFAFNIYGFNVSGNVSVVYNLVETNGVGTYNDYLVIEVENEEIIYEGFCVSEINEGKYGWTYSDAVWEVMPVFDNQGWTGEFEFTIVENGNPATYDEMFFINEYYRAFVPAPSNPAPEKPAEENPNTGAPVFASAMILAAMGVSLFGKRK